MRRELRNAAQRISNEEVLKNIVGGWISSDDLWNNSENYVGKDYILSRRTCFFGIHEDCLKINLMRVYKDEDGNTKITYKILKYLNPLCYVDEKRDCDDEAYTILSNCFLTEA